jgi:hypothetical protein
MAPSFRAPLYALLIVAGGLCAIAAFGMAAVVIYGMVTGQFGPWPYHLIADDNR